MAIIALAGATGHVGKTIAEVLSSDAKHSFIVLSRKEPENRGNQTPVHVVDYTDVASLSRVLEDNKVDTVISAILVKDDQSSASEVSLAKAARMSITTKRFIASDYAALIPKSKQFGRLLARQATTDELQKTDLEWTTIRIGQFADNLGIPHIKSYMAPLAPNVDMANRMAAIPGTGDDIIAFSYSFDVAKFVVAALDLPQWDRDLFCYSDKVSLNQLVRLAEKARGGKFNVVYDSVEKLKNGEITELPHHTAVYSIVPKTVLQASFAMYGLYAMDGLFDFPREGTLNEKFPDIKTLSMVELLGVWEGR